MYDLSFGDVQQRILTKAAATRTHEVQTHAVLVRAAIIERLT